MDPSKMTTQEIMMYATVVNVGVGFVVGLIPLIIGFVKKNIKFGAIGFVGSIVGGALLGIVLSVPVAAVFTWLIIRGPKKPESRAPGTATGGSENP